MWDDHGDRHGIMDGGSFAHGSGVWMFAFMVLVLVALTLALSGAAWWLVRTRREAPGPPAVAAQPEARRLLDQRLAQGEITPEEYQAVRAVLDP